MSPLQQGQSVVAIGSGGKAAGRLTDGQFIVKATKMADGSLIQPTSDARRSIQTMLERAGAAPQLRAEALARFDAGNKHGNIIEFYREDPLVKAPPEYVMERFTGPRKSSLNCCDAHSFAVFFLARVVVPAEQRLRRIPAAR